MGELLPNKLCNSRDSQAGEASLLFRFLSNKTINTTKPIKKGYTMEQIAQMLRKAYTLIQDADTTDIDAFYLAVEEAQGYIAEALDLTDTTTN